MYSKGYNILFSYVYIRERNKIYFNDADTFSSSLRWQDSDQPRHRFTAASIYELPFGKGRSYLSNVPKAVDFARRHQIIVCHDAMYSELRFDGYRPPSFLETPGAMEVGVEFHSLSKTYSMTGWRIGFSVGNAGAIAGLGKIKTNVDSGVFQAVQEAGIAALTGPQELAEQYRRTYQERRDVVVAGLKRLGWEVDVPKAAFFVWAPVPGGLDSRTFAARMLNEVGCVITPGVGFGPSGEGFYRIALTIDAKRLEEAMDRLRRLKL